MQIYLVVIVLRLRDSVETIIFLCFVLRCKTLKLRHYSWLVVENCCSYAMNVKVFLKDYKMLEFFIESKKSTGIVSHIKCFDNILCAPRA
uniref:Uncharacterized protein n=1 Tax=Physcomitrium patens TaxID=3218 RepID=A0A2K1J407_PHYPA|nr:hypothetical protein PHYPA_022091 [Physcomitrium patens]